jgi:hypothetical protein
VQKAQQAAPHTYTNLGFPHDPIPTEFAHLLDHSNKTHTQLSTMENVDAQMLAITFIPTKAQLSILANSVLDKMASEPKTYALPRNQVFTPITSRSSPLATVMISMRQFMDKDPTSKNPRDKMDWRTDKGGKMLGLMREKYVPVLVDMDACRWGKMLVVDFEGPCVTVMIQVWLNGEESKGFWRNEVHDT